jgi:hypothetical protein
MSTLKHGGACEGVALQPAVQQVPTVPPKSPQWPSLAVTGAARGDGITARGPTSPPVSGQRGSRLLLWLVLLPLGSLCPPSCCPPSYGLLSRTRKGWHAKARVLKSWYSKNNGLGFHSSPPDPAGRYVSMVLIKRSLNTRPSQTSMCCACPAGHNDRQPLLCQSVKSHFPTFAAHASSTA